VIGCCILAGGFCKLATVFEYHCCNLSFRPAFKRLRRIELEKYAASFVL
jgi:hypothetical protein